MIYFKNFGIRIKLTILSLLGLVGMIIILLIFVYSIDKNLYHEEKSQAKKLIDTGMGVITYFHHLETSGELTIGEGQKMALHSLASATFGDSGYFWINNIEGVMLMNPYRPELIGTNLINVLDASGHYPFRQFIAVAKKGGGWVEYYWPKPGKSGNYPKISYVAYFKPWGWVLGTGIYLDDMENEIRNATTQGLMMIVLIFIVLISTSMLLSSRFMKQLQNIAVQDPLTMLHTRRYLHELAPIFISNYERNRDQYLAVIFFDVDHFKKVNDSYGHDHGDHVLVGIGKTIKDVIRKSDLGIRYGGEEFLVVMVSHSKEDVIQVAERIRELSHELVFQCREVKFRVTLSAGVSFCTQGEDFDSLIQRADQNLYKAKNSGRDRIVS